MRSTIVSLVAGTALMLSASAASAAKSGLMTDATVKAACATVWAACEGAQVTDAKTGKTGYQAGEWKEGDGLWANCIAPLAHGKGKGFPVPGLANPPSQQDAKACVAAKNTFCTANATDPCHKSK